MSSCVCKILFKSEQICGCCCKMLRGSLFLGTHGTRQLTLVGTHGEEPENTAGVKIFYPYALPGI